MSYSNALSGPRPGDSDYRAPKPAAKKPAPKAPVGPPDLSWIGQGLEAGAALIGTFSGQANQQARNALEAERVRAGSAAQQAATQLEIERIRAQSARTDVGGGSSGSNTPLIIGAVVGGVVLLAVLGVVLLKS